jgi:hypothetical protein
MPIDFFPFAFRGTERKSHRIIFSGTASDGTLWIRPLLVLAAQQAGLVQRDLQAMLPCVRELPFDSERKRMSTVHALPLSSQGTTLPAVLAAAGLKEHADHLVRRFPSLRASRPSTRWSSSTRSKQH